MKYFTAFILASLCVFIAYAQPNITNNKRDYATFIQFIKPDMKYKDIVTFFGEPDKNIGSGVDIYVFNLSDSSKAIIGYSDKILYVEHVDKNKKIVERTEMNHKKLTYDYFIQNFKKEMKYSDIVNTFGPPSKNIGSGIDIYQYNLEDKTKILIGYTDKTLYVKHVDKSGKKTLHVIYDINEKK